MYRRQPGSTTRATFSKISRELSFRIRGLGLLSAAAAQWGVDWALVAEADHTFRGD
jgi:hypothetical protein